jgi:hypothetical protein
MATISRRKREEMIDTFLERVGDGDGPHTAARDAGATLRLFTEWASEDNDAARAFKQQWDTATNIAREAVEKQMRYLAIEGTNELVVLKDHIASEVDPTDTAKRRYITQKRYSEKMLELLHKITFPEKHPKGGSSGGMDELTREEILADSAPICPDEPGPDVPIL